MESACNRNGERDAGADPGRGCQLDLHGVQLNVTTIIADQTRFRWVASHRGKASCMRHYGAGLCCPDRM
jgi:hypothetical protein